jgi:hypothetical protein
VQLFRLELLGVELFDRLNHGLGRRDVFVVREAERDLGRACVMLRGDCRKDSVGWLELCLGLELLMCGLPIALRVALVAIATSTTVIPVATAVVAALTERCVGCAFWIATAGQGLAGKNGSAVPSQQGGNLSGRLGDDDVCGSCCLWLRGRSIVAATILGERFAGKDQRFECWLGGGFRGFQIDSDFLFGSATQGARGEALANGIKASATAFFATSGRFRRLKGLVAFEGGL